MPKPTAIIQRAISCSKKDGAWHDYEQNDENNNICLISLLTLVWAAHALAINVLPVPGGPYNRTPEKKANIIHVKKWVTSDEKAYYLRYMKTYVKCPNYTTILQGQHQVLLTCAVKMQHFKSHWFLFLHVSLHCSLLTRSCLGNNWCERSF